MRQPGCAEIGGKSTAAMNLKADLSLDDTKKRVAEERFKAEIRLDVEKSSFDVIAVGNELYDVMPEDHLLMAWKMIFPSSHMD